jgi:hypothetical protein
MEALINIIAAICVIVVRVVVLWGSLNIYELGTGRDI